MYILGTSEDIKTSILKYKQVLKENKTNLQAKQESLLSIFDNAKDNFDNNKIESVITDIKKEISYQKNMESAIKPNIKEISYQKNMESTIKPNIDDYIKQENYKRKHKLSTWLKSCIVKPFPTWSDDGCEVACMVAGLISGWWTRIYGFGADSEWGIRCIFMMGCILAFSFSIPFAVKAFYFKNGNKFGIFYFVAELIMLIGSIIWFCLY